MIVFGVRAIGIARRLLNKPVDAVIKQFHHKKIQDDIGRSVFDLIVFLGTYQCTFVSDRNTT